MARVGVESEAQLAGEITRVKERRNTLIFEDDGLGCVAGPTVGWI
jgi:hypothetical protein